ncbi:MAG: secretin N-terminal domain-containing protein [Phycisphaerae bacterium]
MKRSRRMKTHGFGFTIAAAAVLMFAAGAVPQERGPAPAVPVPAAEADAPATTETTTDGDLGVKMTRPDTFDVHVKDADLRGVLQLLATQGRKNIIASQSVGGEVTIDLYGVTFEQALQAVLDTAGYTAVEKDNFIYIYTPEEYAKIQKASRKTETRLFRLAYINATDAQSLIAGALSPDGRISLSPAAQTGLASSATDAGGNAYATGDLLIVTDYEENLDEIAALVEELDVKPQQVLIEATILQARLSEDNALGIDFTALSGVDFRQLNGTTDFSGVSFDDVTGAPLDKGLMGLSTGFSSNVSTGGLQFGYINNEIGVFLRALEGVTDTTVLANPKLLVLNKHRGDVMVGRRDGYLTTTVTDTVATQTVEFLETGTRLLVRPYVARDGFIRLEIHPEDSSGSISVIGNNSLPTETTTEITSNVLIRDGHTIVIGGLFRESTTAGRSQIPVAGNLPYVGSLFRSTSDATAREEVIILITPHIIKQEVAEAVGKETMADVERMRIGARKGLRWWGRERLAKAHVRWARKELRMGRPERALWNLDMALSYRPGLMEAIKLRERLTEEAYWSSQVHDSSTRYLIEQMIMQEMGKPVDRIIPPYRPADPDQIEPRVRERFGIEKIEQDPWRGYLDGDRAVIRRRQPLVKEEEELEVKSDPGPDEAQEPEGEESEVEVIEVEEIEQ